MVAYREGTLLRELAARFGVHHLTAAANLVHRGEPVRGRALNDGQACEAVDMYEGGMTLAEVGRELGVSQGAVRRAVAARGVTIRPRGRVAQVAS